MDEGYNLTHEELVKVEHRCVRMFRKAEQELKKTIDAYFADFADLDAERQQLVKEGKMTQNEYLTWRSVRIGQGKRFEALRDDIAKRLTNVHAVALEYINDTTPRIYALNRNFAAYEIEQGSGVAFNLVDEATVRDLLTNEPDLMPEYNPYYPKSLGLQTPKDLEYGKRVITHEVTAGIMQGKSVYDIADSLQASLVHMNRVSAVRAARTAVTAAQNGGRMATYKQAIEMGIPLQKEWMATLDSRTRDSHGELDGTAVDYDKPFSNGLMYPGDPSGKPREIYNCRCCLVAKITGYKYKENVQTYKEWKAERDAEEKQQKNVDKSHKNSYTGTAVASPTFVNSHDDLYENAKKVKHIDGFEDVVCHADSTGFVFTNLDRKESFVNAVEFSKILKESELYKGGNIRLIACSSGAEGSFTAQILADKLGVTVMAPSHDVYIEPDGYMYISSDGILENGKWNLFYPREKK